MQAKERETGRSERKRFQVQKHEFRQEEVKRLKETTGETKRQVETDA